MNPVTIEAVCKIYDRCDPKLQESLKEVKNFAIKTSAEGCCFFAIVDSEIEAEILSLRQNALTRHVQAVLGENVVVRVILVNPGGSPTVAGLYRAQSVGHEFIFQPAENYSEGELGHG
jgi:hypothetical protein